MAVDLPQMNLFVGIDPDLPLISDSPDRSLLEDGLELCMEHNEALTSSNQTGGAIESFSNTLQQLQQPQQQRQQLLQQLQQPWQQWQQLLQQLQLQPFRCVMIGNGFGANDQEPSSAYINGLGLRTEHNESPTFSNQIGGGIEAFLNIPRFFNQGPASAAVNGGELIMTGGIHLYDGGVGRGDGIGNGFGANDQEPAFASIIGEFGTTNVRASDYFRHVRTENGEVHYSFVNVDGRVINLTQEPHLNNPGSRRQLVNKVMLAITGQTGIALMLAALNDQSTPFPPAFNFVVAATTVGFITTMISMLLDTVKPWASGVLSKVGAVAGSSAIILAMGMALHMRHIWVFLVLCIITAAAVLFGHT